MWRKFINLVKILEKGRVRDKNRAKLLGLGLSRTLAKKHWKLAEAAKQRKAARFHFFAGERLRSVRFVVLFVLFYIA
jgi:hypothetical protein